MHSDFVKSEYTNSLKFYNIATIKGKRTFYANVQYKSWMAFRIKIKWEEAQSHEVLSYWTGFCDILSTINQTRREGIQMDNAMGDASMAFQGLSRIQPWLVFLFAILAFDFKWNWMLLENSFGNIAG